MSTHIHNDYGSVSDLVLQTNTILQAMSDEADQIKSLKNEVAATMQSLGLDSFQQVQNQWDGKMDSYKTNLMAFKGSIDQNCGPDGFVSQGDVNASKLFLPG